MIKDLCGEKDMRKKDMFVDFTAMTFGTLIVALSVFFFMVPSHAAVSSISGLAIVINNFIPYSISSITFVINIFLLIIGFITCGHEFGLKTVYTSLLMPVFLGILEKIFPNAKSLTGDATIDVICYIFTVSIGLSILFNRNASSGGLDIVAKIMNKYLRMDLGRAMSISGLLVAFSAALAFDGKTVALSVLGSYFNGIILDHFIFDHNLKRRVCIVSPKEEEIRDFILRELGSGATLYKAIGAYRMKEHTEIITIVDKQEFLKLMNFIQECDPQAFVTVYKVSDMHYRSKKLEERIF